jgi:hypothetical protein
MPADEPRRRPGRAVIGECGAAYAQAGCLHRSAPCGPAERPWLIWRFQADLKEYRTRATAHRRISPRARFDRILLRRTGFVSLDRLLAPLHANKAEPLKVLERPQMPSNTNRLRERHPLPGYRRRISAGTRTNPRSDCPDKFLGGGKICTKLGSRSGTSPIVSPASPIRRLFCPCQSSSSAVASPLDTSDCLGFSPFYRIF